MCWPLSFVLLHLQIGGQSIERRDQGADFIGCFRIDSHRSIALRNRFCCLPQSLNRNGNAASHVNPNQVALNKIMTVMTADKQIGTALIGFSSPSSVVFGVLAADASPFCQQGFGHIASTTTTPSISPRRTLEAMGTPALTKRPV